MKCDFFYFQPTILDKAQSPDIKQVSLPDNRGGRVNVKNTNTDASDILPSTDKEMLSLCELALVKMNPSPPTHKLIRIVVTSLAVPKQTKLLWSTVVSGVEDFFPNFLRALKEACDLMGYIFVFLWLTFFYDQKSDWFNHEWPGQNVAKCASPTFY